MERRLSLGYFAMLDRLRAKKNKDQVDYLLVRSSIARLKEEGLLKSVPIDPEEVAERLNVDVVFGEFEDDVSAQVSGFIEFLDENSEDNDGKEARIFVNSDIHPRRQVFTIAHELGHFLMHRNWAQSEDYQLLPRENSYESDGKPAQEIEADAFAADLLVPLQELAKVDSKFNDRELANLFLVSEDVIRNRRKALRNYRQTF